MSKQVYLAKPEVLAEKVPKTFKLFPIVDWWYLKSGYYAEVCPESGHSPNCIRFVREWWMPLRAHGHWYLKTPIDIISAMPGTDHKLTFAQIDSMIRIGWGTWIVRNDRVFRALGNSDVVWGVEGEAITQGDRTFVTNKYAINRSIAGYEKLDTYLYASLDCLTGAFNTHFACPLITVEYVPTVPPTPATVRIFVYNRQTGKPVWRAYVSLLSGDKVVASGYTGLNGWVTFENVPAGTEGVSYT
ncbi:MAG: hypothetical protein AB1589_38470, partial [Cyanobacteriota bacterium]